MGKSANEIFYDPAIFVVDVKADEKKFQLTLSHQQTRRQNFRLRIFFKLGRKKIKMSRSDIFITEIRMFLRSLEALNQFLRTLFLFQFHNASI